VNDVVAKVSLDNRRFIALLEHPVALLNHDGRILDCNTVFQDQLDTVAGGPVGQPIQAFLNVIDRPECEAFLMQTAVSDDGAVLRFSTKIDLNGAPYRLSLAPMQSTQGGAGFLCQLMALPTNDDVRLEYLMEHLDQGVWDFDVATASLAVSKAWRKMRGMADDLDINAPGRNWLDEVHPEDRVVLRDVFEGQARGDAATINIQYRHQHAAGHWVWVLCRAKVVETDAAGRPLRIVGTDTDVTQIRQQDNDFWKLTSKLKLAIDGSGIGVWEFDPVTNVVHWDDRMLQMYGLTDDRNYRPGKLWETYLHPDDLAATMAYSDHCQHHGLDFRRDYRIVRPDGEVRHIRSLASYVEVPKLHVRLIGVNIDVTDDYQRSQQLEQARAKLEYDSHHDALTGLANRRLLDEKTNALCAGVTPDCRYAVLHLDLDYFKRINDALGHAAGDAVLVHVATTLRGIVADAGLVCRTGGDEFVILFEKAPASSDLEDLCKAVIAAFEAPFWYKEQRCAFGVSIGFAFGQGKPARNSEVFIKADAALYAAKQAGRGCYRAYSHQIKAKTQPEANARQALIDALAKGDFVCHYQPQYDANTRKIVGAEALIRWECPDRGLLTPDAFLPLASELGLADRMDAYVFEQIIAQQSQWFAQGLRYPKIAMNVSRARFDSETMLDHVQSMMCTHHNVAFELLETAFLDKLSDDQARTLCALRDMQIGVDLDDFGSGHSSVTAMQAIKPDRIKVDQSLVGPITVKPEQLETLQLLSQMARLEGIGVVIQGLDTQAHLAAIGQVDCDVLQGYALQVPMALAAFEALLSK
jgi:diguanylate cyclase (GGDEF)-like protein/PAS domain S-box-containing protein